MQGGGIELCALAYVAFYFCLKHKLLGFYYKTGDLDNWFSNYQVSHPWIHDRSTRNSHFTLFEWILRVNHADTGISDDFTCPQIVDMPGFELGSTAWKPGVLTTRLFCHHSDILSSAQTEFGADNVSVHKTLVRAKVNGSKHTFRSPGELAAAVAKKNKPAPQIQSPGSASLPSVGVSPSCYVPAPASSDPVPVCQSTPVAPLSQGLASTGSNVRRNSSYMQKLNLMNKPFYPHHPKPRGFPSRNGRGGYRNNRAPFNRRQFSQNNFSKSYDYKVNRPFQHQLINNHYNRQKFRPHPDFSTVNRFGTYYG